MHKTSQRLTNVATVLLATLAVTSCSPETNGTPNPTSAPASSTKASVGGPTSPLSNEAKAPSVANPLKSDKFLANPCSMLTEPQLQEFQAQGPGKQEESDIGIRCTWDFGPNKAINGSAGFIPSITDGLSNAYGQNAAGWYKDGYFEPAEVDGYPAVYQSVSDQRSNGVCGMLLGISNQTVIQTLIQRVGTGGDACKNVLNLTKAALKTIKEGQ